MKTKLIIPFLFLILCVAGCARLLTPVYAPQPPGSTNAPVIAGYVPNTNAVGVLGTAGAIGSALPPPFNWAVNGAAALGVALLGTYARRKTVQASLNGDKAAQAQDIINATIAAIEAAGQTAPDSTKIVKQTIATHVAAAGYSEEFDKQVQAVSNKM